MTISRNDHLNKMGLSERITEGVFKKDKNPSYVRITHADKSGKLIPYADIKEVSHNDRFSVVDIQHFSNNRTQITGKNLEIIIDALEERELKKVFEDTEVKDDENNVIIAINEVYYFNEEILGLGIGEEANELYDEVTPLKNKGGLGIDDILRRHQEEQKYAEAKQEEPLTQNTSIDTRKTIMPNKKSFPV